MDEIGSPPTPESGESPEGYCSRLDKIGFNEIAMRKAVRWHFGVALDELGGFFEQFVDARLRLIEALMAVHPKRSRYSLMIQLERNWGIPRERAEYWIELYCNRTGTTLP